MGQCEDDTKIPFPVVHSILIRRECISCIFWLVQRQIRDKKLQLRCGWSVKTTLGITPSKSVLQDIYKERMCEKCDPEDRARVGLVTWFALQMSPRTWDHWTVARAGTMGLTVRSRGGPGILNHHTASSWCTRDTWQISTDMFCHAIFGCESSPISRNVRSLVSEWVRQMHSKAK